MNFFVIYMYNNNMESGEILGTFSIERILFSNKITFVKR